MELNLDRLNGLRFADFQEKQPSTTPTEPLLEGEEYKTSAEQENALKRQIEGYKSPRKPSSTPQSTNNQSRGETRLKAGFFFLTFSKNLKKLPRLKNRGDAQYRPAPYRAGKRGATNRKKYADI